MSFTEINRLRKSGQLEEALAMARQELDSDPENIWNKRAMAWVFYEYLKQAADSNDVDSVFNHLDSITELRLPEEEKMLGDQVAWQVALMMFELQRKSTIENETTDRLFEKLKLLSYTIPSKAYSVLLKGFLNEAEEWPGFTDFCDWWGLGNFMPEDFEPFVLQDGTRIMALAEQAYIACAKKLVLRIESFDAEDDLPARTAEFLAGLEALAGEHPGYIWATYYLVKLLHLTGKTQEALERMIPFARGKAGEFWTWDQMADLVLPDLELRMACFCKSLLCRAAPKYLVKTREDLAECLVELKMVEEASLEIALLAETRKENGWVLPDRVRYWMEQPWYKPPQPLRPNKDFYKKYSSKAEMLLLRDVPDEIAVITGYDPEHRIVWFIISQSKNGSFRLEKEYREPRLGDVCRVWLQESGIRDRYNLLGMEPADELPDPAIFRSFTGKLRINSGKAFGFVEAIFIHPSLLAGKGISNGDIVKGNAVLNFNEQKQEWGWKAISLETA